MVFDFWGGDCNLFVCGCWVGGIERGLCVFGGVLIVEVFMVGFFC